MGDCPRLCRTKQKFGTSSGIWVLVRSKLTIELSVVVIFVRKFSKPELIVSPAVGGDEYALSCTYLISVRRRR